jgi:hypothetical protein
MKNPILLGKVGLWSQLHDVANNFIDHFTREATWPFWGQFAVSRDKNDIQLKLETQRIR